jgi:two-component system, sensor histidine kinase PdtaS
MQSIQENQRFIHWQSTQLTYFSLASALLAAAPLVKIHRIIPILLLMSSGVTAQLSPAEALHRSRQAQDAHHFEDAKTYAQKAITGYLNTNQPDSLGEAYVMLWSSSSLAGLGYSGRIPILDKARQVFEQAGNRKRLADVLTDEAELYHLTDTAPVALHMALQALQIYQTIRYPKLQAIYNLLTSICIVLGDYNEGIRYGLLSIHTAAATGDTSASMSAYYNHLAVGYTYINDWENTEKYLQKGLAIALKYHDTASVVQIAANLARNYIESSQIEKSLHFYSGMLAVYPRYFARDTISVSTRLLDIYTRLRRFQQCEPFVRRLEKFIPREDGVYYVRLESTLRMARYYMDVGNYDTARHYLNFFAAMGKKYKLAQASFAVPYYYFRLDSLSGHYLQAIRNYERYKSASDSNLNVTRSRQVAQYSALYETDQKDKSIQLLKQEADIQAGRLRQEVFFRRITIGGVALLLLLLSLLYYAYRVKRRSNQLLQEQRTVIDQKNLRLERLVTEKELLMTEIHHRVKNNLYLISSLLESQGAYLQNEALYEIQKSQHRVQAISLIHQKLFLDGQATDIDMSVYLQEIVSFLRDSLVADDNLVFNLDLDPIHLDVAKAVPLGLIVNEAVTNAVKYAFPLHRIGRIEITLKQGPTDEYHLCVADNGVGLPRAHDGRQRKSLGMSLIEGLSRALQARLHIHSNPGTTIEVVFAGTPPHQGTTPLAHSQSRSFQR